MSCYSLYGENISTSFKEMRQQRTPKVVWRDRRVQSGLTCALAHDVIDRLCRESEHRGERIHGQQQPPRFRDSAEEGARTVGPDPQPVFQCGPGTGFEKDSPFSIALADDPKMRTVFVLADVRECQTRQFSTAQSPGVEDGKHGRVANTGRGGVSEQRLDEVGEFGGPHRPTGFEAPIADQGHEANALVFFTGHESELEGLPGDAAQGVD